MTKETQTRTERKGDEKQQEVAVATESKVDIKADLLSELAKHIQKKEYPQSKLSKRLYYTILIFTSASCTWLYVDPSQAYGDRMGSKAESILQLIGNTTTAAVVMLNISRVFLDHLIKIKAIDADLKPFIDPNIKKNEKIEMAAVVSGAFLSAIPLTAPAYQYSDGLSLLGKLLKALVVQVDYTFNHTFPMMLLVNTPYPRMALKAPFLPLILLYRAIKNCCTRPEEKYSELLAKQTTQDYQQLKDKLVGNFSETIRKILRQGVHFNWESLISNISGAAGFKNALEAVTKSEGMNQYFALVDKAIASRLSSAEPPAEWGTAGVIGAVTMTAGVIGFVASELSQTEKLTGSRTAGVISTFFPAFVTGVITTFFGNNSFQNIFNFIKAWRKNEHEIPLAVKLYPKTVGVALAIGAFLSYYSSGTAIELVLSNFPDSIWRSIFAGFAHWGVASFTYVNVAGIIFDAALLYAKKFGSDDEKMAVHLAEQADRLSAAIARIDGKQFAQSLKELPEDQLMRLVGMNKKQLEKAVDHEGNLQKTLEEKREEKSCWGSRNHFLNGMASPSRSVSMRSTPRTPLLSASASGSDLPVGSAIPSITIA